MGIKKSSALKRAESPYINGILGKEIEVLDKGFIRVIDYMGNDSAVVQAARISYGEGTKKVSDDQGLIHYLMRNGHTSPFEMCEIKLHIKAPIFVARQWLRHRTASVNEYSARYSVLRDEFYTPEGSRVAYQSVENLQGSGETCDTDLSKETIDKFTRLYGGAYKVYNDTINSGVSRELARSVLPVACYTEFYWKIDLHNLLHFLRLRLSSHSQVEIREYAECIAYIVGEWVPVTMEAFDNHELNSRKFSRRMLDVVRDICKGKDVSYDDIIPQIPRREWNAAMDALDRKDLKV